MATGPLWWLPGQDEWEQLTEKIRQAMARQILRGLKGAWPSNALETSWERDRSGDKDPQTRPTPLRAFLRTAAWLPTQQPGHGGGAVRTARTLLDIPRPQRRRATTVRAAYDQAAQRTAR